MRADRERGQAATEGIGLWLALALVGLVLAPPLVARAAPVVAGILRAAFGAPPTAPGPSRQARALLGRALTRPLDGPTLLAATALLATEVGAAEARRLVSGAVARRYADSAIFAGGRTVTGDAGISPLLARYGARVVQMPSGPLVVAAIADSRDEPAPAARNIDFRGAAASAVDAAGDAGVERLEQRQRLPVGAARLVTVYGAGMAVQQIVALLGGDAQQVGPALGQRAGDVLLCQPVSLIVLAPGRPAASRPGITFAVVRDGHAVAGRTVPGRSCPNWSAGAAGGDP